MDKTYNLNDVAMMTGFTTRTLRNYLAQGILKGEKENGAWRFTPEELDRFFADPFVKEGLRIKRSSIVFDFLAENHKNAGRTCVILDIPAADAKKANEISAFFCEEMEKAKDAVFNFAWDNGSCRIILSGAEDQIAKIMRAYGGR